jgi:hypothetical protein
MAGIRPAAGGNPDRRPPPAFTFDVDRTVADVDPLLFGDFAEHLGRVIYGGIYDEKSPLADADGFCRDVAVPGGRDTFPPHSLTMLRFKLGV